MPAAVPFVVATLAVHAAVNSTPPLHSLRLNGRHEREGKLEIYHAGEWGKVCDDSWDLRDAEVACRQLKMGEVEDTLIDWYDSEDNLAYGGRYVYDDSVRIWMDNVRCTGNEANLADCAFHGWGHENCGSFEAVAIRCKGPDPFHEVRVYTVTLACVCSTISLMALALSTITMWRVTQLTKYLVSRDAAEESGGLPMEPVMPVKATDYSNLL